ncbi:MAG TPA: hypothetical protein VJT82_12025, partial [Pyrinomonadaceae bacterium]|nr:hypothetical protein [Pyrinomonadaceae bacterium]
MSGDAANVMPAGTIILDIEGTTTPIDFVYKVLFPYARARVKEFISRRLADEEVRASVAELFAEHAKDEGAIV